MHRKYLGKNGQKESIHQISDERDTEKEEKYDNLCNETTIDTELKVPTELNTISKKSKEEKWCSCCSNLCSIDLFSNRQLRLGGKRRCKRCVSSKRQESGGEITSAQSDELKTDTHKIKRKSSSEIPPKKKKPKEQSNKRKKSDYETDPNTIKAILKQRPHILPTPLHKQQTFELDWTSSSMPPVSRVDEMKMKSNIIKSKGNFRRLNEDEMQVLSSFIECTNIGMTLSQSTSFRMALLQQKAMHNHHQLQRQSKDLRNRFDKGECILSLSAFVDCPPVNVFRVLLSTKKKWSKDRVRKSLRDPQKYLKGRELKQFELAEENDAVSCVNQGRLHEYAEAFERVFEDWLTEKGITFVTQAQLQDEQEKNFGIAKVTPDFLFIDKFVINGCSLRWIDCKAFFGSSTSFNLKKMKQQTKKYVDLWGDGGVLFLQGHSEALAVNGCTMLNAYGILGEQILSDIDEKIMAVFNSS